MQVDYGAATGLAGLRIHNGVQLHVTGEWTAVPQLAATSGRHARPPTFKASTIKASQPAASAARPTVAAAGATVAATATNGKLASTAATPVLPTISNPLRLAELSALFVPISATDATGMACAGTSFTFVSVDEVKVSGGRAVG